VLPVRNRSPAATDVLSLYCAAHPFTRYRTAKPRSIEEALHMTVEINRSTQHFESDVSQVLDLVVHSLYQDREVFLRELLSNAADACDKLRFDALGNEALLEGDAELRVEIEPSKARRTLTVRDNGIGMSREEITRCLGTIAHSGTREFLNRLSGEKQRDNALIGQFGVGFYAAFMVAEKVVVYSRRAGLDEDQGVRWESEGKGEFSVEGARVKRRGTEIVLHLREDANEFLEVGRLGHVVRQHSDHLPVPVMLPSGAEADGPLERVNRADALWLRRKGEVSDEEYREFYKHLAHDWEDPAAWVHAAVEGRLEYRLLLFIPKRAPFGLWDRETRGGVKLYVKRVFITDDAERLMPRWLRFVRGVIDTDDLPLNVSRETLQSHRLLDQIRSAATKRVLTLLGEMAGDERYPAFWKTFGAVLKEGVVEDAGEREALAKLLRFATTREPDGQVGLATYRERAPEGQKAIYYVTGEGAAAARANPQLEVFAARGIEVLVLGEPIDDWLVMHLTEFDGWPLVSVAAEDLDVAALPLAADAPEAGQPADDPADAALCERLEQALGERVQSVRPSARLTASPSCLVAGEGALTARMQRMLAASGESLPVQPKVLEVNLGHALLRGLAQADAQTLADGAELLLAQAELVEGGRIAEPARFIEVLNRVATRATLAGSATTDGGVDTVSGAGEA
jgi:molecular chaperone HtpG